MTEDVDFSRESLDATMAEYEPLLCDGCKEKLRFYADPIRKRLNEGKPPRLKHIRKLTGCLCPACFGAIVKKKARGA